MNHILKVAEDIRTITTQDLVALAPDDLLTLAIALEDCQNLVTDILVRKESTT